jgi:hypothetical protein
MYVLIALLSVAVFTFRQSDHWAECIHSRQFHILLYVWQRWMLTLFLNLDPTRAISINIDCFVDMVDCSDLTRPNSTLSVEGLSSPTRT